MAHLFKVSTILLGMIDGNVPEHLVTLQSMGRTLTSQKILGTDPAGIFMMEHGLIETELVECSARRSIFIAEAAPCSEDFED